MTVMPQDERIRLLRADFERVVAALADALAHPSDRFARRLGH